jgi:hypothetical protein
MPFLSGSSVHFKSVNETIIGVPPGFDAVADLFAFSSPNAAETLITISNTKTLLM